MTRWIIIAALVVFGGYRLYSRLRGRMAAPAKSNEPRAGGRWLAFRKLLRANMLTFVRERATLFWTFAFPLLFIVIFGSLFSRNSAPTFAIGLAGDQGTPAAEAITGAFQQVSAFHLHQGSLDEELSALKAGNRNAVVELPAALGASPVQVQIYYDSTILSNQQILLPLINQVLSGVNANLTGTRPLIVPAPEPVQTHQLSEIDYLLPGIMAMALMQLGLFSAQAIVTQRETRVLRRLGATPLLRSTLVLSQVAARLVVAAVQMTLLIAVAAVLFNFRISGNVLMLTALVALGALVFVALGYVVAALAPTTETAQPIAQAISFPMLLLSGVFFPISGVPAILQPLVRVLPLTYLSDALRQVTAGGTPLNPLWIDALMLGVWLLISLAFSVRFFRWE
jgi:ABC-2 type transport system permease protein